MNQNQQNPFLFACGVPRSGTTLLQRMLNSHPELAVANDSHFIPRALEMTDKSLVDDKFRQGPIALTDELVANVRHYHRFYRLGISDADFESVGCRASTYQQLVTGLYDVHARNSGKRLAGEKTPDYVRRLKLLHGLFPNAKLVHLIRDGRNVALSLMQWAKPDKGPGRIALWNENPIAVCALWWRWLVLEHNAQTDRIDPAVCVEIKYEALTERPEDTICELCESLEIEYSPQMVDYNCGKSARKGNRSAKSAWLAPKTGLRNWQTDMGREDVELFEALAADALSLFDYEIKNERISAETGEIARQCQSWWNRHFLAKHRQPISPASRCENPPGLARSSSPGGD